MESVCTFIGVAVLLLFFIIGFAFLAGTMIAIIRANCEHAENQKEKLGNMQKWLFMDTAKTSED